MKRTATAHFSRKFKTLAKQYPYLPALLDDEFELYETHPNDPSLRLHELRGVKKKQISMTIGPDLLVIFQLVKEGVLMVDIGNHDEVY